MQPISVKSISDAFNKDGNQLTLRDLAADADSDQALRVISESIVAIEEAIVDIAVRLADASGVPLIQ